MKKFIFVFFALSTITLLSGCGNDQNTVRFNNNETEKSAPVDEVKKVDATSNTVKEVSKTDSATPTETTKKEPIPSASVTENKGQLAVTSIEGGFLKTTQSYNAIRGVAPSNTRSIQINGYKLQQYTPGKTKWTYVASAGFGTLNKGLNNYVVKALDGNGKEIDSLMFSIQYDAPTAPAKLPGVGVDQWMLLFFSITMAGVYSLVRKNNFYKI